MASPTPSTATLTQAERDRLVQEFERLDVKIRQAPRGPARRQLVELQEQVWKEYWSRLPHVPLSRCPYCNEVLKRAFDPWGVDGLWWQRGLEGPVNEPTPCRHFGVLCGAVHLQGLPPKGGLRESYPGPEVPYVIPRVLELPTMMAVISTFRLGCGYPAYPIAYFYETPPRPGSLTQPWTRATYSYRDANGQQAFAIPTDPWDFDLPPWVQKGKIKWIEPGDPNLEISKKPASAFPYANLPGRREQLVIWDSKLRTLPPPNNEDVQPFD